MMITLYSIYFKDNNSLTLITDIEANETSFGLTVSVLKLLENIEG